MIVHLFEPHSTYVEHPGFPITDKGDTRMQKYDYEIAFEDGVIGDLLDALDKDQLAATTTVVLMSDHGEAFNNAHGSEAGWYHGMSLYEELLHVPMIFRIPGTAPATRGDVVQLVDLAPTIACLFGVAPAKTWAGRCLAPALAGKPLPPMGAFAEMLPAYEWKHEGKSMMSSDAKRHVVDRISDNRWEVFDLDADPKELKNLEGTDSKTEELHNALAAWVEGPLAAGGGK
jgi:arylsulfatase A-like enzyme